MSGAGKFDVEDGIGIITIDSPPVNSLSIHARLGLDEGFRKFAADATVKAIELICARYRERDRIGMSSVHAAGETTSYSLKDMPPQVAALLSQYRRVVPQ